MPDVTTTNTPYVDRGTGLYSGPSEPEVYDNSHEDAGPTGAYPGPSEPEVYESPDPTVVAENVVAYDPAADTRYEHPLSAPKAEAPPESPPAQPAEAPPTQPKPEPKKAAAKKSASAKKK